MLCLNFLQYKDLNGQILKSQIQINIVGIQFKYSSTGCVLEVYLEYPQELRELDNNYPLASDKIEIKEDMLSNYQLNDT